MARSIFRVGVIERGRVEAFSDGVLAIVITLLVLEIQVPPSGLPEDQLWQALIALAPKIIAWVISFLFVLVFWVAHHYFFASLKRIDRGLLWLNGLFLLFVSFIPFPTGLAGEYPLAPAPLALLSLVMGLASLMFPWMRAYARGAGLHKDTVKPHLASAFMRSWSGPIIYTAALGSAFWEPIVSVCLIVLVPMIFFIPHKAQNVMEGEE